VKRMEAQYEEELQKAQDELAKDASRGGKVSQQQAFERQAAALEKKIAQQEAIIEQKKKRPSKPAKPKSFKPNRT